MKTLTEMLACALRELSLRKSCYPKWIEQGRLTQEKADHEIECMRSIIDRLEMLRTLSEIS